MFVRCGVVGVVFFFDLKCVVWGYECGRSEEGVSFSLIFVILRLFVRRVVIEV